MPGIKAKRKQLVRKTLIIQNNIALNHLGKMVDFNFHCGLL